MNHNPEKGEYWRYRSSDGREDYVIKIIKVLGNKVRACPVKKITNCVPMMFLVTIGWTIYTEPECWEQVTWPDLKPVTVFHKLDKELQKSV